MARPPPSLLKNKTVCDHAYSLFYLLTCISQKQSFALILQSLGIYESCSCILGYTDRAGSLCQFEGVGCIFHHPPVGWHRSSVGSHKLALSPMSDLVQRFTPGPLNCIVASSIFLWLAVEMHGTFRSRTASPFQSQYSTTQSRQNVNAPVFVPKGTVNSEIYRPIPTAVMSSAMLVYSVCCPTLESYCRTRSPSSPPSDTYEHDPYDPYDLPGTNGDISTHHLVSGMQNMQLVGAPMQP